MHFHIDPSNGLAIYDQVVRQVKFAVADGAICEGELIPSVRELLKRWRSTPTRSLALINSFNLTKYSNRFGARG